MRELLEHPTLAIGADSGPGAERAVSEADLADLMARFEEAARALQSTHESLQGEVRRLERELRETKGQLRRAQDLAALGEMAAGIAHEVRNPLGSIRLYAEVLVHDLTDRPQERTIATKVAHAVNSLNAVVNDVLVFSREVRVSPQTVDARDAFSHAIDACASLIGETGTRVTLDAPAGVAVHCDPTLMHQALVNVIRNACEAASEVSDRPLVGLSAGERTVLNARGRRAPMRMLRVEDDGPGVPPGVHARMFNPFFTTRATGTGLGLAIVHRILDAHAGRVDIRNKAEADPGARGALVDLLLPIASHPDPNPDTTPNGDHP